MSTPSGPPAHERTIPFRGHRVWTRTVGVADAPRKLPLLCLHGGPGVPHDYLEPLEAVAATGRAVVFYDQLGGGRSDQPRNPSLWTVDLFLAELAAVRDALGLARVHLLGQSWGGMSALEYAATRPAGLASLNVASSPARMADWEAAGTTGSAEYEQAMLGFYGPPRLPPRRVARLRPAGLRRRQPCQREDRSALRMLLAGRNGMIAVGGRPMTIIETTAQVDERGNVTVAVPEPFRGSGRTVQVTLSMPELSPGPMSQQEWSDLVDRTAGSMPTLARPPQPPITPAPGLG